MPTIRLATDDDMRAIDSRNIAQINDLPHLYIPIEAVDIPLPPLDIPTVGVDLMRTWGVAMMPSLADFVRMYTGALVAPRNYGQFVARADLLFYGAEPAAEFVSAS
jgi:hypothetical protein